MPCLVAIFASPSSLSTLPLALISFFLPPSLSTFLTMSLSSLTSASKSSVHNYLSTRSDLVITAIIEATQDNTALLHNIMASYGLNTNPKIYPNIPAFERRLIPKTISPLEGFEADCKRMYVDVQSILGDASLPRPRNFTPIHSIDNEASMQC